MLIINKTITEDKAVVAVEGRLDTVSSPELQSALGEFIEDITELVIDFENVDYISSAGLRVLLWAQKIMNKRGIMKITNVSEANMEIFTVTGFYDILNIV